MNGHFDDCSKDILKELEEESDSEEEIDSEEESYICTCTCGKL